MLAALPRCLTVESGTQLLPLLVRSLPGPDSDDFRPRHPDTAPGTLHPRTHPHHLSTPCSPRPIPAQALPSAVVAWPQTGVFPARTLDTAPPPGVARFPGPARTAPPWAQFVAMFVGAAAGLLSGQALMNRSWTVAGVTRGDTRHLRRSQPGPLRGHSQGIRPDVALTGTPEHPHHTLTQPTHRVLSVGQLMLSVFTGTAQNP